ncbi:MAG: serine hydrolase domain-containing protein [Bacteroidota bacterium]
MKNINFLSTVLFSLGAITCSAQNLEHQFDEMLNSKYPANEPGATVLVAVNGEIVYNKAYGMANLELDVPMQPHMIFQLASITKQFTAISILMLMEDGKLDLNDEVTAYIPDYPTNDHTITIRNLLTHTSGITRSITQKPWNSNIRKSDFKLEEFIDYFKNEPIEFKPGTTFRYNNFGYLILAYIIEKVSGMTYPEFIKENIFRPLNMVNSYSLNNSAMIKNRAYGYQKKGNFINKEYTSSILATGAGSLMSTVEDLFIWNRALKSNKLVRRQTLKLAYKNYEQVDGRKTNYGFGFFLDEINGSPTIEHAGGDYGFRTNAIYLPEEDVFVAVFTNCSCNDPKTISTKMAALAIDKPYKISNTVFVENEDLYK